jgi:hypothetical protein
MKRGAFKYVGARFSESLRGPRELAPPDRSTMPNRNKRPLGLWNLFLAPDVSSSVERARLALLIT